MPHVVDIKIHKFIIKNGLFSLLFLRSHIHILAGIQIAPTSYLDRGAVVRIIYGEDGCPLSDVKQLTL